MGAIARGEASARGPADTTEYTEHTEGTALPEPAKGGLLYEEESYAVIGACFEVYKEKGCGSLEAVYQECLTIELGLRGIPFEPFVGRGRPDAVISPSSSGARPGHAELPGEP